MPYVLTAIMLLFISYYVLKDVNLRQKILKVKGSKLLWCFLILAFIVALLNKNYIGFISTTMFLTFFIYTLFAIITLNQKLFDFIVDICCFLSIFMMIIGLIQKLILGFDFRSTAVFMNANYFGCVTEFVIILAIYRLYTNPCKKWFYISVILINIINIFLCDTMSVWLSLVVGILIFLILKKQYKIILIFLGMFLCSLLLLFIFPEILPRLSSFQRTFEIRVKIWTIGINAIKEHPLFGQGMLTYKMLYPILNSYKTLHTHSLYLDPIVCFGFVGVSIFLAYCIKWFKVIITTFKTYINNNVNILLISLTVVILIHGITDYTIYWIQTGMFAFLIYSSVGFLKKQN